MKTLADQMTDIEKLDELRRQVRTLKQEAIQVLAAEAYGKEIDTRWTPSTRDGWDPPGDDIEKAQVLRALLLGGDKSRDSESCKALIGYFCPDPAHGPTTSAVGAATADEIPILRCAYVLQALVETPKRALSATALECFRDIVWELNEIVHPTWVAGAARGDDQSLATAFVTGECARALLAFHAALSDTAEAARLLEHAAARKQAISGFGAWTEQEQKVQDYSLKISLASLPHLIIDVPTSDGRLTKTPAELLKAIEDVLAPLSTPSPPASAAASGSPATTAGADPSALRTLPRISTEFKKIAETIATDTAARLVETLKTAASGRTIAQRLQSACEIVKDVLLPIEQFAESTIDRQLAAGSPHLGVPIDGAELVFAATLLGLITDWKRPKVRAAYEVLRPLLSANGRLLSIRPFDLDSKGYRLHVATLEVTRGLADLVANLEVEPEPEFVERLMLPFEYTRMPGDRKKVGWTTDPPKREPKSLWWQTAIAAFALDSTEHMLDRTINRRILPEFQVRHPDTISFELDKLFYPDYGLAKTEDDRPSVAILLQKLRAHAGRGRAEPDPLFSLILYGPPGTGKSTLVEALAHSAGAPLVEITPSDILVGGTEGMERRARQVFRALSKLTHVVILFDEFDSILLDRAIQNASTIPTSVVEFLTPGMLTKLKELHEAGKTGRISYILATNYLNRIDPAAAREGRFDEKCGIFPPDVISRFGRLRDQLMSYHKGDRKKLDDLLADAAFRSRLLEVINMTAGAPMSKVGKPGYFTAPKSSMGGDNLFGYLLGTHPSAPTITPEADLVVERKKYDKQRLPKSAAGRKYWKQWGKIADADTRFAALLGSSLPWTDLVVEVDKLLTPPAPPT